MQSELTTRQRNFLNYLREEISRSGKAPSLRQAAGDLGVSHAAVGQAMKALEDKGYLRREGRYSRTVHLLNQAMEAAGAQRWREVPVVGRVAAGLPMYAQQEWEGSVVVDSEFFRGRILFALRIKGNSMKGAGILHRDLAICEPCESAQNGEIIVALIDEEEATVKRIFLFEDHIELRPENTDYEIMSYSFDRIMVQGKVVGIQRGPEGIRHEC